MDSRIIRLIERLRLGQALELEVVIRFRDDRGLGLLLNGLLYYRLLKHCLLCFYRLLRYHGLCRLLGFLFRQRVDGDPEEIIADAATGSVAISGLYTGQRLYRMM